MSYVEGLLLQTDPPRQVWNSNTAHQNLSLFNNFSIAFLECRANEFDSFGGGSTEGPEVVLDGVADVIITESVSPLF